MRSIIIQFTFFLSGTVLLSCKKEKTFRFRIINNSPYDIQEMLVSGTINEKTLAVTAFDTLDSIDLTYEKRFRLNPKLICIQVKAFSNSGTLYSGAGRPCAHFSKGDLKEGMNVIRISPIASPDTTKHVFDFTLN